MWGEASGSDDESSSCGEEPKSEAERLQAALFNDVMEECRHNAPGARLSARLRAVLERLSPEERRRVVSCTREGCAPLLVAARRGNAELVEYLVHVCCAELEQRGRFHEPDERAAHRVTPLWAAAVAGRLAAVRALADAGADLDAPSDSGSTPLRSACFMTHYDVVRFLLERGADPHRPNHTGGTCLINAVQAPRLCRLLLERGVAVDARDAQGKTALLYAVQEHRADTARLLLAAGADPRLASLAGDDALRTACVRGAAPVAALLMARGPYDAEQLADALELLGATQLDELNDARAALDSWRRATELRHAQGELLPKRPERAPAAALGGAREWRTLEELDALAADADALRTQALLVAVRVLGPAHRDTVFRLMYRGAAYADALRYRRCLELWRWALEIRIERDTLACGEAAQTACAVARLLADAAARGGGARAEAARWALAALAPLTRALPAAQRLAGVRPRCRRQAAAYDLALRAALQLLQLAADCAAAGGAGGAGDAALGAGCAAAARALVAARLRAAGSGDSVLHLAASRLTGVRSAYFAAEAGGAGFPSVALVRLLLRAGAAAGARNAARSTALHVAAVAYNFSTELVEALLAGGAHLDQPNRFGDSAASLVAAARGSRVRVLRHVTLGCLAARALLAAPPRLVALGYDQLPPALKDFVDLHRP